MLVKFSYDFLGLPAWTALRFQVEKKPAYHFYRQLRVVSVGVSYAASLTAAQYGSVLASDDFPLFICQNALREIFFFLVNITTVPYIIFSGHALFTWSVHHSQSPGGMHHTDENNNDDKGTGIMTISSSAITPKCFFPGSNNADNAESPVEISIKMSIDSLESHGESAKALSLTLILKLCFSYVGPIKESSTSHMVKLPQSLNYNQKRLGFIK